MTKSHVIIDDIIKAKQGQADIFEQLIHKFEPVIKYKELDFESFRDILTKTEFDTVYRLFVLDNTAAQIANQDGISRYTVNKTKNRALKKLKELI